MSFVNGQGRKTLVNTTVTVSGSLPSSVSFGTFLISEMAGILGMVKCDSNFAASLVLNYMQDSGAATVISSALSVSSGIIVNELNPGAYVGLFVTGISSNSPVRAFLTGLPIR